MHLEGYFAPDHALDVQLCEPVVTMADAAFVVVDGDLVPLVSPGNPPLECYALVPPSPGTLRECCAVPLPTPWLSTRVLNELRAVGVVDPMADARLAVMGDGWRRWRTRMARALVPCAASLLDKRPSKAAGMAYVAMLLSPRDTGDELEPREFLEALGVYLRATLREWLVDDPSGARADAAFVGTCKRLRVSPAGVLTAKCAVRGGV